MRCDIREEANFYYLSHAARISNLLIGIMVTDHLTCLWQ